MFQGATELALDAKGRFAVPTRHREALTSGGAQVVLTAHPDGCLLLYPRLAWEPIRTRVQSLGDFSEQSRWWKRLLVGYAEEIEPDGSGRLLVSPTLRKYARLDKALMLVGQGSHFEIWDVGAWGEKLQAAMAMAAAAPPPGTENFSL
ncbi:MAG: division/cell wall cluster transcriptional repressor MraZ [Burkholderiales bacterium]|nr:division/cell wall cluster transcriptional repressor MraZ [Burkholderiales bacterium]